LIFKHLPSFGASTTLQHFFLGGPHAILDTTGVATCQPAVIILASSRSTHDLRRADQITKNDSSNGLHHYSCLRNPCPWDQASRSSTKWASL